MALVDDKASLKTYESTYIMLWPTVKETVIVSFSVISGSDTIRFSTLILLLLNDSVSSEFGSEPFCFLVCCLKT
jgi:hypothetical protein